MKNQNDFNKPSLWFVTSLFVITLWLISLFGILIFNKFDNVEKDITFLKNAEYRLFGGENNYTLYEKLADSDLYQSSKKEQLEQSLQQMETVEKMMENEKNTEKDENESDVDETKEDNVDYINWTLTDEQYSVLIQNKTFSQNIEDSEYLMLEYSDIECPFCKQLHMSDILDKIVSNFDNKIAKTFVNFPLPMHENAMNLAKVAQCSFEKGEDFSVNAIKSLFGSDVSNLESNTEKLWLTECVKKDEIETIINNNMNEWIELFNLNSTPSTVFVNISNKKFVYITFEEDICHS